MLKMVHLNLNLMKFLMKNKNTNPLVITRGFDIMSSIIQSKYFDIPCVFLLKSENNTIIYLYGSVAEWLKAPDWFEEVRYNAPIKL